MSPVGCALSHVRHAHHLLSHRMGLPKPIHRFLLTVDMFLSFTAISCVYPNVLTRAILVFVEEFLYFLFTSLDDAHRGPNSFI